jgi:hypothetical protein
MPNKEDDFHFVCNVDIKRVIGFLKTRYNLDDYHLYRGTFLSSYPNDLKLIHDRLDVYCKMFALPHKLKDKEHWFISNVNQLVNHLLDQHPIRWYHFGRDRRDLISYRSELESILRYNHNLKNLPGEITS